MQATLENHSKFQTSDLLTRKESIAPLVTFRVIFGFMMLWSIVRFAANGWIKSLYIEPTYYFTYFGFSWVSPLGDPGMYWFFGIMALASIGIMLGAFYRISALVFFLTFTYVELIDKTNYLNHYYFVSLVALLMVFLPAQKSFSLDALRKPNIKRNKVVAWVRWVIPLQLAIVYFFAGVAKLNPEWLFAAQPLKIWLPSKSDLPLIGGLLTKEWVAYVFSWFGALYDLTIVFFLLYKRTRIYAYLAVLTFHIMTAMLFQIGMFPFIMMLSTLVFFPDKYHEKALNNLAALQAKIFGKQGMKFSPNNNESLAYNMHPAHDLSRGLNRKKKHLALILLATFFVVQLFLPFRYLMYPGNLFWTEQGYRFSWRVMLMEKAGYAIFHIKDNTSGKEWEVNNRDYLTANQEKMMSTQPDMILQFAKHLEQDHLEKGYTDISIFVESYVALNGRNSRLFIDPQVDLTQIEEGFEHKTWILPFKQ